MKWIMIENTERLPIDLDNLVLNIVDDELAEEGIGKLVSYAILSSMLGSAGIVEGAELDKNMESFVRGSLKAKATLIVPGKPLTITKSELRDIVEQSKKEQAEKKVGEWKEAAAINVVARTLYMEARGEGPTGLNMVMTVIWNRSSGDKEEFAPECLRYKQFSCWNKVPASQKTPSGYSIQFPKGAFSGGEDQEAWNRCQDLARSMFDGRFKPLNSQWNAYYNPAKANPDWKNQLTGKQTVGHHIVGRLKDVAQHAKNTQTAKAKKNGTQATQVAAVKTKNYTVKDGESLWSIAGKKMSVVNQIKALNGLKSDTIKPGQTLKIPA